MADWISFTPLTIDVDTKEEDDKASNEFEFPPPPRLHNSDSSDFSDNEQVYGIQAAVNPRLNSSTARSAKSKKISDPTPIGFFWDIENCQVPRGCSALDVVAALRQSFLYGRTEADFVVVCDARKETPALLQDLNDAQVSLIHVCAIQKNAADEKLRQYMRRFAEQHPPPAVLLLISGDVNFAADLSDLRHRRRLKVILVHGPNASRALIATATQHYRFSELTQDLPRTDRKFIEPPERKFHVIVGGLGQKNQTLRVAQRLKRLAYNCGGKVLNVEPPNALLKFTSSDLAIRAVKRMDGEDVFGYKISATMLADTSSDEGYGTPAAKAPTAAERDAGALWRRSLSDSQPLPLARPRFRATVAAPDFAHDFGPPSIPPIALGPAFHRSFSLSSDPAPVLDPSAAPSSLFYRERPAANPPDCRRPPIFCAQFNPERAPPQTVDRNAHWPNGRTEAPHAIRFAPPPARLPLPSHYLTDPRVGRETSRSSEASPSSSESGSERSGASPASGCGAELAVHNLPPLEAGALREALEALFAEHVEVVRVAVAASTGAADGLVARVTLRDEAAARLAVSRLHRKHWRGRRLLLSPARAAAAGDRAAVRARLRHLLEAAPERGLPLLRLRELYAERFGRPLPASELSRAHDLVRLTESPRGRRVALLSPPAAAAGARDAALAARRCEAHDAAAEAGDADGDGDSALLLVRASEAALARGLAALLASHAGALPLASLRACHRAQLADLPPDPERGVFLELLVRAVPSVCILEHPVRHVAAAPPRAALRDENKAFAFMMDLVSRELTDLLVVRPRCSILFTKLVPAYHNHFGRQLRVADFGFTRLSDLLDALCETVAVLGSGHGRIVTLSPAAQSRRFAADASRVLQKAGREMELRELEAAWPEFYGRPLDLFEYGACYAEELAARAADAPRSPIALPRAGVVALAAPARAGRPRPPPAGRVEPVDAFAAEAALLLGQMPKMEVVLSRFVPAYHSHFGRQCHVGRYGCLKLVELLEKCPRAVVVEDSEGGEKRVRLAPEPMRETLRARIVALAPVALAGLAAAYLAEYAAPLPSGGDPAALVALLGLEARCGVLTATPPVGRALAEKALAAAACLPSERCVRGGSVELRLFERRYALAAGAAPPLEELRAAGVLDAKTKGDRVALSAWWRCAARCAALLAARGELSADELTLGAASADAPAPPLALLRCEPEVFEESSPGVFRLRAGLRAAAQSIAPPSSPPDPDAALDTPPGHRGSRVFESPAASSVPFPLLLLQTDHSRRRRLAPFFGSTNNFQG